MTTFYIRLLIHKKTNVILYSYLILKRNLSSKRLVKTRLFSLTFSTGNKISPLFMLIYLLRPT